MRATRNIYIPEDLAMAMEARPGVNWSEVAQKAFRDFLDGASTTSIRFEVDQQNAIRIGFNCNGSARIRVDVTKLDFKTRALIADHFHDGWMVNPDTGGRVRAYAPTFEALVETLRKSATADDPFPQQATTHPDSTLHSTAR